MSTPIGRGFRGQKGAIGFLLRQAQQSFANAMEHVLAELNLSTTQYTVLSLLQQTPAASGAQIARDAMLRRQTINEVLTNLEARGLIERTPTPADRRLLAATLTAAGHELLVQAAPRVKSLEQAILAGSSPRQEDQVRQWLVQAAVRLSAIDASNGHAPR